ncbi:MAG: non-ribosomal peptide synthetase, partial [Gammaproteobacteria bacterium]|nr:non-ribosomal peptide synthetase [Gammaproteobacteria bacterium]
MTESTHTSVDALNDANNDAGEFEAAASFAQQRLWFLDQLEPGSPVYNINMAFRLRGDLDVSALQTAVNQLVARHETLRTTFDAVDQETIQVIAEAPSPVPVMQSECGAQDEMAMLRSFAAEPFDLARGPLLRVHLLRRNDDEHVLLLVIHHIIADAWSLDVLYRELVAFYECAHNDREPELPELPVQYADYAEWQHEWLSGDELETQLRYWREHLADAPELLELPLDRPRPRIQTHAGATLERPIDAQLADGLKALAQQAGCTQFILYLAAFATLLSRWAAAPDLVIGTPIAGRKRTELEGLIGFFVNTVGMRISLEHDPTFAELLAQVKKASLGAFAHQDLPFEKLVEELHPERSTSYSPLFQVMFVLHHGAGKGLPFADLQAESLVLDTGTAKFDLTLFVTELNDGASALIEYNTDLFDTA